MSESHPRGRFVWYELLTADPEEAKDFYSRLIGWGIELWEHGAEGYTMWTVGETPIGGVLELPEEARARGAPSHWLPYICSTDVAEDVSKAEGLGATTLTPPTDIPAVGRFAVIRDPQGAFFAMLTPLDQAPGHDGVPRLGEFSWHELMTTDCEAAFEFYSALFGWRKLEALDMGEAGPYQLYAREDHPLGGMYNKSREAPVPPGWLLYVHVSDVATSADAVRELGGRVLTEPLELSGGDRVAHCADPQRAAFALHSKGSSDVE